jgi:hypothetical protein
MFAGQGTLEVHFTCPGIYKRKIQVSMELEVIKRFQEMAKYGKRTQGLQNGVTIVP